MQNPYLIRRSNINRAPFRHFRINPMLIFLLLMALSYWYFTTFFGIHQHPSMDDNQSLSRNRSKDRRKDFTSSFVHYNASILQGQGKLLLWSSDFHISPIADIKDLLQNEVHIIDKSLSGHCHLTNTCESDLRILNKLNGIKLSPCSNQLRRDFYNSYRTDSLMQKVDAFICTHAASLCELFMPFKKPLVIIASTRYEIGRLERDKWIQWNENLQRIASNKFNTIAANNRYDQEYIKYFTGIDNVLLLPNVCGYTKVYYKPTKPEILLSPARGVNSQLQSELMSALSTFNQKKTLKSSIAAGTAGDISEVAELKIVPIRDLYTHFMFRDLASHPAIVILPYQVSFMSFFEYYRMQIPMLVPSPVLLTKWHLKYHVLNERTWMSVYGMPASRSVIDKHPNYTNRFPSHNLRLEGSYSIQPLSGDPNDEFTSSSVLEWISLADFYQWPHIKQFDSWSHLFQLLTDMRRNNSELNSISKSMGDFNREQEKDTRQKWNDILDKIYTFRRDSNSTDTNTPGTTEGTTSIHNSIRMLPDDINQSLLESYGFTLSTDDCSTQINALKS